MYNKDLRGKSRMFRMEASGNDSDSSRARQLQKDVVRQELEEALSDHIEPEVYISPIPTLNPDVVYIPAEDI